MDASTFFANGIDVPTHLGLKRKRSQRSTTRGDADPEHDTCVFRDFPRHKTAHLRFITSVCVKKYAPGDDSQRHCPLLECTEIFPDKEAMCQHLYRCKHLSKGRYWCLDCRKGERVSKFHCKHCPSRASSVAKKFFSKLGSRFHQKECYVELDGRSAQAVGEKPWSDILETPWMVKSHQDTWGFSPGAPFQAASKSQLPWPAAPEAPYPVTQAARHDTPWDITYSPLCELPDSYICEMPASNEPEIALDDSELLWDEESNWWFGAPEKRESTKVEGQSSRVVPASQHSHFNQLSSCVAPSATQIESQQSYQQMQISPHQFQRSNFAETQHIHPRCYASPRPTLTCSTQNLPQINNQDNSPLSNSGTTNSPYVISPLSSGSNTMAYRSWPTITISPTDSEASTHSLFSNSALSMSTDASSWNNSLATSPAQDLSTDKTPHFDHFGDCVQRTSSNPWSSYLTISPTISKTSFEAFAPATHSSVEQLNRFDSSRWSSTSELLHFFSEILEEQLRHSKSILRSLRNVPLVMDLLDLSPMLTVSIGLDALADLLKTQEVPKTVMSIFAFTHIVYACSLTAPNRTSVDAQRLFDGTLNLVNGLAVQEQKEVFREIVKAIWQPSLKMTSGPVPEAGLTRYLVAKCKGFLDELEICARSTAMADFIPQSQIRPHDELLFNVKTQIMGKLIPEFYADGLIEDLVAVENLVKQFQIKDFRGVELALLGIGKEADRDDALIRRLVARVAELFDAVYAQQNTSRMSYHLRDIAKAKRFLDDDIFTESDSSDDGTEIAVMPLQQIQKNVAVFSREADKTLVQATEPKSLLSAPTIDRSLSSSSTTSTTSQASNASSLGTSSSDRPTSVQSVASKPKAKYRCTCGYEPQGEERWKASNLARHRRTQHSTSGEVKVFVCPFPGCDSSFNRSDNLRMHCREKGHDALGPDDKGDVREGRRRKRQRQMVMTGGKD